MRQWEHPYLLASAEINFGIDFYKKYIQNKKGGNSVGNNKYEYHFDRLSNREGFFLGKTPHCVDVFIEENEAIINNFSYFTNCALGKNFPRKDGTRHMMNITLKIIKEDYPIVNLIKLSDNSMIHCGRHKFPMCNYLILMYGYGYYMQYGFVLQEGKNDIYKINKKIEKQIIKIEDINIFIENNDFSNERNDSFLELCKNILQEPLFLRYFLQEIRFIKDMGKKKCVYFFSFIQYIYYKWFSSYNFMHRKYIKKI